MVQLRATHRGSPGPLVGSDQQARPRRAQLHATAVELAGSWPECWSDPQAIDVLRGLVLALDLDRTHPVDRLGGCSRRRWSWRWPITRRRCAIYATLAYAQKSDTVNLRHRVFFLLPGPGLNLREVRIWLTECEADAPRDAP